MRQSVLGLIISLFGSLAHAQPYSVTRVFGIPAPDFPAMYSFDVGGGFDSFTITSPVFEGFNGLEYDRPRERVVLIGTETGAARLVSVNASLEPSSLTILRSGLDENASQVDVDPETGRIYWWENGEILSVNPDGSGAKIVEADNVPEPVLLEIDVDRGFYMMLSFLGSEIMIGELAGASSPAPTMIPEQLSGTVLGIAIEPLTGDLHWSEYLPIFGFTGDASAVYRLPYDNLMATPEIVIGSGVPSLVPKPAYYGVAAIADQVVVTTYSFVYTDFQSPMLNIMNTTTGEFTAEPIPTQFLSMDLDYYISPIIQQPVGAVVDRGDNALLEVIASDMQSTFQWYRNGVPVQDTGRIMGATTNELMISNSMLSDTDTYSCMVTTSAGDQQTSDEALFAVRGTQEPECIPDLNDDGRLNFFDVSVFLQLFGAGCP